MGPYRRPRGIRRLTRVLVHGAPATSMHLTTALRPSGRITVKDVASLDGKLCTWEVQTLPPYQPKYMNAWCHGSPGIGLSRLRAWELTGQEAYRTEVKAALISTVAAIEDDVSGGGNYSLCHGIGGNCDLPLLAAKILGQIELHQLVERVAIQGMETYENVGKPPPHSPRPHPAVLAAGKESPKPNASRRDPRNTGEVPKGGARSQPGVVRECIRAGKSLATSDFRFPGLHPALSS